MVSERISNKLASLVSGLTHGNDFITGALNMYREKRETVLSGKDLRSEELRVKGIELHNNRIQEITKENELLSEYGSLLLSNGFVILGNEILGLIDDNNKSLEIHRDQVERYSNKEQYDKSGLDSINRFIEYYEKVVIERDDMRKEFQLLAKTDLGSTLLKEVSSEDIASWEN